MWDEMRLTTKGRYAVRAVLDLVLNDGITKPIRLQEISDRQDISLHYLEQLFRRLRKGNVVRSVRGPGGGYTLARTPELITMKEVLINVGENIDPAKDLLGKEELKVSTPEFFIAKSYFLRLGTMMDEYLSSSSLADICRNVLKEREKEKVKPGDETPTLLS